MQKITSTLLYVLFLLSQATDACVQHLQRAVSAEEIRQQGKLHRRSSPTSVVKTAIHNVRVWDGNCFSRPRTIVIDKGVITDSHVDIKTIVDGTGKYLIPGLMDSHVHINDLDGLRNITSYGVTTSFNMASRDYEATNALRNQPGLSNYLSAGIPAIGPGSHHQEIFSIPTSLLTYPNSSMEQLVDWSFGNGSDFYKIVSEHYGPHPDQEAELVEATHKMGKLSVTHAASGLAWEHAVASGTDIIQHIPPQDILSAATIATAKEQGQLNTPTMEIFAYALADPAILGYLQANASGVWAWPNVLQNVAAAHKAGIPILAGTDAVGAIPNSPLVVPFGITLHDELRNLVSAGLTPREALRAATIMPAKVNGLSDRGEIALGKRADLVLLNSNPMKNISNSRDIEQIWVGGVVVDYVNKLPAIA